MRKIFMSVLSCIENDGRVKRSAITLSRKDKVYLLAPSSYQKIIKLGKNIVFIKSILSWDSYPLYISLPILWIEILFYSIILRPNIIYIHGNFFRYRLFYILNIKNLRLAARAC